MLLSAAGRSETLGHTLFLKSPVRAKCRNVSPGVGGVVTSSPARSLARSLAVVGVAPVFLPGLMQTQRLGDGEPHSLVLWKQNSCYTNSLFGVTCARMMRPQTSAEMGLR